MSTIDLRPQKGSQEDFLSSPADIAIGGGAAGCGKTWALLVEPLRHYRVRGFGAVIFRRNATQVREQGGLWDESIGIYSPRPFCGRPAEQALRWSFPGGGKIKIRFRHLEYENTVLDLQGAQIPFQGWDELTHFTERQFWYLLSRNRSRCGVRPYVRATCNPDADSFVAGLIEWWIDPSTGYPIPERSGILRWFNRVGDDLVWADDRAKLPEPEFAKSLTFIPGRLEDNQILLRDDPGYRANLMALGTVERERLLHGNWKIRPAAGLYFQRGYFEIISAPVLMAQRIRRWDIAATAAKPGTDPDWTVGVRMAKHAHGYVIEHIERFRGNPAEVERTILATAESDGAGTVIGLPQDPGAAGKAYAQSLARQLAGYVVKIERETGDKVTRASPFSAQCAAGNVALMRGPWNDAFLLEAENFPEGKHDDQIDASAGAFNMLTGAGKMKKFKLGGL